MASESSAKAGSRPSSGELWEAEGWAEVWEMRREEREVGRRGVVGREGGWERPWEVERVWLFGFGVVVDIAIAVRPDARSCSDLERRRSTGCTLLDAQVLVGRRDGQHCDPVT